MIDIVLVILTKLADQHMLLVFDPVKIRKQNEDGGTDKDVCILHGEPGRTPHQAGAQVTRVPDQPVRS
jgi:hypothetical protein